MTAMPRFVVPVFVAVTAVAATHAATAAAAAEQTSDQLQQRGRERVARPSVPLRTLEVTVVGDEATLTGRVSTFWDKHRAIERALGVNGISSVASEMVIPAEEDEQRLAEEVGRAVRGYPHYRIWDLIDGRVNNGVVTLFGRVTPERNKEGELFERIAKIHGVQDVQVNFDVLPTSRSDTRLRRAIARRGLLQRALRAFRVDAEPPVPHHRRQQRPSRWSATSRGGSSCSSCSGSWRRLKACCGSRTTCRRRRPRHRHAGGPARARPPRAR